MKTKDFLRGECIVLETVFFEKNSINDQIEKKLPFSWFFRVENLFRLILRRFYLSTAIIDGFTMRMPFPVKEFLKNLDNSRFLPCNHTRARLFYSKYGDDTSYEARKFRKRGREVLKIAKLALDRLEIRFWLSSGTCLGSCSPDKIKWIFLWTKS